MKPSLRVLDLALLDVEDGIRLVPLGEDFLIPAITRYRPCPIHGAEEGLHVERTCLLRLGHAFPSPFPIARVENI